MTKRNLILAAALLIGPTMLAFASSPACRSKVVVNSNDEVKVVVPFAVPVGVPVATLAPYFYSAGQFQSPVVSTSQICGGPVARPLSESVLNPEPRTLNPPSVATRCATCHGGPNPKAGFSLASLETLSASDRLNAIRAVVSGKMPKGGKLTGDEIRAIVDELARTSEH